MTSHNPDLQTKTIQFLGRDWMWPAYDKKLHLVNDWVHDALVAIKLMQDANRDTRGVVQAGGACGVWPIILADHFKFVWTFEPDHLNYHCLTWNVRHHQKQIVTKCAALGERIGMVATELHPSEKDNCGAIYTVPADTGAMRAPMVRLDDETIFDLDLICLDIEGREVEALIGANELITKHQPWIMIEEKPLPQMGPGKPVNHQAGEATKWLEDNHGYTVAKLVHRDVILRPPE